MKNIDTSKFNNLKKDPNVTKIIQAVFAGYKSANKLVNSKHSLDSVHGIEVKPHLQRAFVETELELLQRKFPDTFKCSPKKNKSKNSTHTEIEFAGYILTQNRLEKKSVVPRNARFREELSYFNAPLFPGTEHLPDKIYLILTHFGDEKPEYINLIILSLGTVYEIIELDINMEVEVKTITPIENTDGEIPMRLKDFDIDKAVNDEE